MSDLRHVRQYVSRNFRLLRLETLGIVAELVEQHSRGVKFTEQEIRARLATARAQNGSRGGGQIVGAVAVLPLYGVIDQKIGSLGAISGGTAVDGFMQAFRQALNDQAIKAIVIDADSPGGSVYGVPEAAAEILAARGKKPIVAVANPQIASAAYYLCCAADSIACLPSGEVGSIGVFALHESVAGMNAQIGYEPTYIYARKSPYKVETNPDQPLSDDAHTYLQGQIDDTCEAFLAFVAKARKLPQAFVEQSFGGGRMLLAKDAKDARMIDSIETIGQVITRLDKNSATRIVGSGAGPRAPEMSRRAGHVPKDVSEELAPSAAAWKPSTLADFTKNPDKQWADLGETDQRRIASHYAWSPEMPPAAFEDLKAQHHRPSDGKVVKKGLDAAYAELDADPAIPSADKPAARAHLDRHSSAFDARQVEPDEDDQPAADDQSTGDAPVHQGRADGAVERLALAAESAPADDEGPADLAEDLGAYQCACHAECACMNGGLCGEHCRTCRTGGEACECQSYHAARQAPDEPGSDDVAAAYIAVGLSAQQTQEDVLEELDLELELRARA